MLKTQNININNLFILSQNDDFFNQTGAFVFYKSNELYYLKQNHIPYTLFNPKNYGINFYGDIFFTSQNEYNKNPQEVKKIIKATKEGFKYAFSHINETIKVILTKYNTSHLSYEKLKFEANILKPILSNFKFNKFRLDNIKNIFIILGIVKKTSFNIQNYLYNPYTQITKREQNFIQKHFIRCITTNKWEPFNLEQNGKLEGISIDYWNIIKTRLHLKSSCKVVKNWTQVLNSIKTKQADITLSTTITKDRLKYAVFSKSYASYPIVLATRNNIGFVNDIGNIKGLIVVGKNYTSAKILKEYYPHLKIKIVANTDEALKLVSKGKAFGAVDILPVIAYKINKYQYSNLKISGKTPFQFDIRFMIRDDYNEFVPIINKIIDSITPKQKKEIYNKWISVVYQNGFSFSEMKYFLIIICFVVIFFIVWIIFMKKDLIKKEKFEAELEKLAVIDGLTGIFNRYKLDKSLHNEINFAKRYNRPFSLIFCDIDYFKKINDSFGHKTGDKVLQILAKIISENIRDNDIFGRWGGEEFLIILPETSINKAVCIAEKLRSLIEKHNFEKGLLNVTCSFGVVEFNKKEELDAITRRVDLFLYKAKNNGRNRIEY